MNLDNLKQITRLDKEDMLDLLLTFPRQCEDAIFIAEHAEINNAYKKKYSNIVFTGLGGSAIGADIIKGYTEDEIKMPVFVNRNYTLPKFVDSDSLVFAISYSGNTEETLSAYSEAAKRKARIIAITSGGTLKELASKDRNAFITIPKGYPPRCALGYSFIPALITLSKLGIIGDKKNEIKKTMKFLDELIAKQLAPGVKTRKNTAKRIALEIYRRFAVIYASDAMASVATRWRGQLAENSKTLSSSHIFPEMSHNEIVGWANPAKVLKSFTAVILKDKGDHDKIKRRMAITASILKKHGFPVIEVESRGRTLAERMLSLVSIGDFTSFYLSILNRLNPTPVDRITYLKKELAK